MRKKIIAANWKMNKTSIEAAKLSSEFKGRLEAITRVDIVICPTFTALDKVGRVLSGTNIQLGAQDIYWEKEGAFTGEISADMVKELGCQYVIVGHSERRAFFCESNEKINKKIKAVLAAELLPVFCIGETLEERKNNLTKEVLNKQVLEGLAGISKEQVVNITIAYEPVWAIGTGVNATPAQAVESHKFIRGLIAKAYSEKEARKIRIQYGGSVKPENTVELMKEEEIDGALVGGASLNLDSFMSIIEKTVQVLG